MFYFLYFVIKFVINRFKIVIIVMVIMIIGLWNGIVFNVNLFNNDMIIFCFCCVFYELSVLV